MSKESNVCRICLCEDDKSNLISACQCAGSVRYLHFDCLR